MPRILHLLSKADMILISDDTQSIYWEYLIELILKTDDVLIVSRDDTYTMEFLFQLYDEIRI